MMKTKVNIYQPSRGGSCDTLLLLFVTTTTVRAIARAIAAIAKKATIHFNAVELFLELISSILFYFQEVAIETNNHEMRIYFK